MPPAQRFRVLYLATESAGAFGESIARFRPDLDALAQTSGPASASRLEHPVIPVAWRTLRRLGTTILDSRLVIADLFAPETIQTAREALASTAMALGLRDIDISALTGPERVLTQEIARYIYEQVDSAGRPLYDGIRYLSHYNTNWECWAIFTDRLAHRLIRVEPIAATTPSLVDAGRILGLRIETKGGGRYVVP